MNHSEAQELIADFVSGLLPAPLKTSFNQHLTQCSACRKDVALWRSLNTVFAGQKAICAPLGFDSRTMALIRQKEAAFHEKPLWLHWLKFFWEPRWEIAMGAAAFMGILFYTAVHHRHMDASRPEFIVLSEAEARPDWLFSSQQVATDDALDALVGESGAEI